MLTFESWQLSTTEAMN